MATPGARCDAPHRLHGSGHRHADPDDPWLPVGVEGEPQEPERVSEPPRFADHHVVWDPFEGLDQVQEGLGIGGLGDRRKLRSESLLPGRDVRTLVQEQARRRLVAYSGRSHPRADRDGPPKRGTHTPGQRECHRLSRLLLPPRMHCGIRTYRTGELASAPPPHVPILAREDQRGVAVIILSIRISALSQ